MTGFYRIVDNIPRCIVTDENRKAIRNFKILEDKDWVKGYVTGFFDAEGTILISKDYVLSVVINQSYKPVLDWINGIFPTKINVHGKDRIDKNGVHHKNSWRWRQFSDKAIPFLEYVNKYSIEKRPQIELALRYQKEEKVTHSISERRKSLSGIEREKRDWFVNELKRLKHETSDTIKNYDNEIKRLKISKDIREGRQSTIISLEEIYREMDINMNEVDSIDSSIDSQKQTIQDMSQSVAIGYISGFFDGEGYIGIEKGKRDSFQLHIANSNSNLDILKLYENNFGGEIRPVEDSKNKKNFQWNIQNHDALRFLKTIEKLTIVKRKQIHFAIQFQEWHDSIGIIRTFEQKNKAEWYYQLLKDLKKETGE